MSAFRIWRRGMEGLMTRAEEIQKMIEHAEASLSEAVRHRFGFRLKSDKKRADESPEVTLELYKKDEGDG